MVQMTFKPCGNCNNGYHYLEDSVTKCSCLISYQQEQYLLYNVKKANIPEYVSSYTRQHIVEYDPSIDYKGVDQNGNLRKINSFIKNFSKYRERNLYFYGTFGTQKSTLMRYIGVQLLKKGYSVYYTLADTLIKELINADRDEELAAKWRERINNCDVLLIDEMSEDKITTYQSGWQRKFILPFLKHRIEIVRKSIIFSSNSPIDNIGEYFEGAIQDLIYREVIDKNMVFTDNYEELKEDFNPENLWD